MLMAHVDRESPRSGAPKTGFPEMYDLAICAYEAGQIAGRMFIDFLGLGVKSRTLQTMRTYEKPDDDVKVVDLGGKFVDLPSLSEAEKELLARLHEAGSKTTAHLTYPSSGSAAVPFWPDYESAVRLVERLLKEHLYDVVKRPMERHWK